ncbi:serine/threonine protein kinase [Arthrobacter dokdonensis]|uniref:serine/threonine protein kinase n=1 Tax=Arthrobacter dokdonellae TaxID=2211210 RepID=UPI000DE5B1E8|nr:protein kinase [Arthrobacter dokdonellae]
MDANRVEARQGQPPVLDGFDAVRRLGGGAQAEVWLVRPVDGGAPLAAKCFAAAGEGLSGLTAATRHNETEITQEWRILAHYDHEHLVRMHGLVRLGGPWQGGSALLMDYAAGGSVRDMVAARGPLSVGECVTVLTPLGKVLSYLHGRGVVHGDVAPGNVLLTALGKPVLGDLGLARLAVQPHGRDAGTPGFFCLMDDVVSPASDVYAMAAVGWFALTGHAPAATRDRMPLGMYAREVPDELAAALEAGLAEDAAQRPTAAELAQAVFRSARAEPLALAQSVHPSVLPELLTRRDVRAPAQGLFWPLLRRRRLRLARPGRRQGRSWPGDRRSGQRRGGGSAGGHLVMPYVVAAAAVALAGAGFAGWHVTAGSGAAADSRSPAAASAPATTSATAAVGGASAAESAEPAGKQAAAAGKRLADSTSRNAAVLASLGPQAVKIPEQVRDGLMSDAPETALAALGWVRSYALSTADRGLLETVNAAGSPAMAADAKVVSALAGAGHSFTGLDTTISGVAVAKEQLVSGGSDAPYAAVTVSATVTTSAFAEQDARGAVVYAQPREQQQRLLIVLVQAGSRWVVQQILPGGG